MASGHVNRTNRPNTWLHRPATRREDSPCQLGAVHTWHFSDLARYPTLAGLLIHRGLTARVGNCGKRPELLNEISHCQKSWTGRAATQSDRARIWKPPVPLTARPHAAQLGGGATA